MGKRLFDCRYTNTVFMYVKNITAINEYIKNLMAY